MSLILFVLGILITGAGVMTIAFGAPSHGSADGQTLIIAGATALVGGSLLIGLAAAVRQLRAIAEALRTRPATLAAAVGDIRHLPDIQRQPPAIQRRAEAPEVEPPHPPEPRSPEPRPPEPRPAEARPAEPRPAEAPPAAAIEVSGSALERLRASMVRPDRVVTNSEDVPLSPNGSGPHPAVPEPRSEPGTRPGGTAETREPRLDFLFRAKGPRPPHPPEAFDSMWPRRPGPAEQPKPDEVARQSPPASPGEEPRPPSERPPRSVAILKSGVVDGMAYTLYADGSIEAQLPHGTVRFGSIAELRAHIENNS